VIDEAIEVFPNNVCSLITARVKAVYPTLTVFQRSLRDSDGTESVGIFPITWTPDDSSFEMPANPQLFAAGEPTLQRYIIGVQSFVKDTMEERGIRRHSILAKQIRSLLYRDQPLAIGLAALSVTMSGSLERIQRRGIQVQRFLNNDIQGVFLFLASCEYYVETQTS
jgi:hypothetical protein